MHFTTRSALIATSCLALSACARPAPAVSYSVVDVDGGPETAGADSAASPTTIYETITKSSGAVTAKATVSITVVEPSQPSSTTSSSSSTSSSTSSSSTSSTYSPKATANISSLTTSLSSSTSSTSSASATATAPPKYTTVTSLTTSFTTASCTTSTTIIDNKTITIVSTLTATPTPSSTQYYDDGMWHTRYAVKTWWNAAPEVTPSPASVAPQWNHSVFALSSSTGTVYPRQLITGTAAPIYPRVAATGTAAPGYEERAVEGTAVLMVERAASTAAVLEAPDTVAAIGARAVAGTALVMAGRAVPTGYNVVSWNETTMA